MSHRTHVVLAGEQSIGRFTLQSIKVTLTFGMNLANETTTWQTKVAYLNNINQSPVTRKACPPKRQDDLE
jgi:hypothetical protein